MTRGWKRDEVLVGAAAGLLGTIAKELLQLAFGALGWSKHQYWHIAASVFVLPGEVAKPGGLILGALGDMITGALLGAVLVLATRVIGRRYLLLKGLGFSWLVWIGLFGLIGNLHVIRITPVDIGTGLSTFLSHSLFGLVTAWLARTWLAEPLNS